MQSWCQVWAADRDCPVIRGVIVSCCCFFSAFSCNKKHFCTGVKDQNHLTDTESIMVEYFSPDDLHISTPAWPSLIKPSCRAQECLIHPFLSTQSSDKWFCWDLTPHTMTGWMGRQRHPRPQPQGECSLLNTAHPDSPQASATSVGANEQII